MSREHDHASHLRVTTHDIDSNEQPRSSDFERQIQWAQNLSLSANIALLLVKAWAFLMSHSFAVLASMADSGVDLASQVVLYFCNRCDQACLNWTASSFQCQTEAVQPNSIFCLLHMQGNFASGSALPHRPKQA